MNDPGNDRLFCWQQIERNDPMFRVTHAFSHPDFADRVLAVNAFLSATGEICAMVSDPGVAARKLTWWRDELNGGAGSGRPHPITAELKRSGAYGLLGRDSLVRHFEQAALRIDPSPLHSLDELLVRCQQIGQAALEMECAVCGVDPARETWLSAAAIRRGMVQLAIEDLRRKDAWWAPLQLLAREGVSRDEINSGENARAERRLMMGILQDKRFGLTHSNRDISDANYRARRLICNDYLLIKKLRNKKFNSRVERENLLSKTSPLDVLTCWRVARRLNPSR